GRAQCGGNGERSFPRWSDPIRPGSARPPSPTLPTRGRVLHRVCGVDPAKTKDGPPPLWGRMGGGCDATKSLAVSARSGGRYRPLAAVVAEGDVDEVAGGDLDAVVDAVAAGPGFDGD